MLADIATPLPLQASGLLVVFARVGAVFMLVPLFSEESIPSRLRLLAALGFAFGLNGLLTVYVTPQLSDRSLPELVVSETLVGLAMGGIIRLMFQAASMAGAVISMQIGLGSAFMVDPGQGGQTPVLGRLVALGAIVLCMSLGVHHMIITAICRSYEIFPVGRLPSALDFMQLAIDTLAQATTLAVGLAAPFIAYGVLFNLALGLSARVAPAIQVFFIAQPLNLMLGLALAGMLFGTVLNAFAQSFILWLQAGWG